LVLINPNSRNGKADLRPALDLLRSGGIELVELPDPQALGRAVATQREADLVIVGGGDGTLNAAADSVIASGLPLGILPLGTANDLARTLELPTDPAAAAEVFLAGRTRQIDLGRINGKPFFNVASLGLSIDVARAMTGETKRRWGVLGYPLAFWRASRRRRSFRADIRCDQERRRVHSVQIWVGNGRHFGGGMTVAADATIDDGMLDLVSLAPRGFWGLILTSPLLRWGHHDDPRVRHWRGTEIEIHTHRPMPINTDGELTTETPARIEVDPKAITVFTP
jgi:YegS/Rv2252/BmrU family lipid kinase